MRPGAIALVVGLVCLACVAAYLVSRTPSTEIEVKETYSRPDKEAPAMCPWRDPTGDLARFFPGATTYKQEIIALSPYRLQIMKRLAAGETLESNALFVYRVPSTPPYRGDVLVRRTAGEYGAIEAVVAVDPNRHIIGVRVQRHREAPDTARLLADPAFLHRFQGKSASDTLPNENPALSHAVHSLLVEFDMAETQGK